MLQSLFFLFLFYHHFYFPAGFVGGFTLSGLLDKRTRHKVMGTGFFCSLPPVNAFIFIARLGSAFPLLRQPFMLTDLHGFCLQKNSGRDVGIEPHMFRYVSLGLSTVVRYSRYSKYSRYRKYSRYSRYKMYSRYNRYSRYNSYSRYSTYNRYVEAQACLSYTLSHFR